MTLVSDIGELARQKISGDNLWYTWDIDDGKLPDGIRLPCGSPYERNVELKRALHASWIAGTDERKYRLIRWYIRDWGGIKGNNEETIRLYSKTDPGKLVAMGSKGIASWSKALCIYDPERYPIFDARVSAALNALLVIGNEPRMKLFPCLSSQNRTITSANGLFRNLVKEKVLAFIRDGEFYGAYCEIQRTVLRRLVEFHGIGVFTLEMILFSFAEELLKTAFPGRLCGPPE